MSRSEKGVFKYTNEDQERMDREMGLFSETELFLRLSGVTTDIDLSKVFENSQLIRLDIESSGVEFLPANIARLVNLLYLNLSNNQIVSLPQVFAGLTSLRELKLNQNQISVIPLHLFNLVQLETLNLSFNFIEELPAQIGKLTKLQRLDLSGNAISSIPNDIRKCTSLVDLNLSFNPLHGFPLPLMGMPHLQSLSFKSTSLLSIPDSIDTLTALTVLNLEANLLKTLPDNLGKLKLKELYLYSNQLHDLGATFYELKYLKSMTLHENEHLHQGLQKLIVSKVNKPMQKADIKKILEFLEKLEKPTKWKKVKLLIVGAEAVGKTSLNLALERRRTTLRSFKDMNIKDMNLKDISTNSAPALPRTISTNGIDIKQLTAGGVSFTTYDFGGQDIFYPTHTFFLTSNSIYVIAFNLSQPLKKDNIEYWLKKIRYLTNGHGVGVVIVGTHCDRVSENDPLLQQAENQVREWKGQFPEIADFVSVSSLTHQGMEKLQKLFAQIAQDKGMLSLVVPTWYKEITAQLPGVCRTLPLPIIPFSDFVTWTKVGSEVRAAHGADFLHQKGILIYFPKSDYVILDPQWLAKVMASIISFHNTWAPRGILKHCDLSHVWRAITENKDLYPFLLQVLERFELSFKLRAGDSSLIPCLLPSEFPQDLAWKPFPSEDTEQIDRIFKFSGSIPFGFFGRLIHRILYNNDFLQESATFWRSGVCINHDNLQWLVLENVQKNELSIVVRRKIQKLSKICQRCEEYSSSWVCKDCKTCLCNQCSNELHSTGKWSTHQRIPFSPSIETEQRNQSLDLLVSLIEKVESLVKLYSGAQFTVFVTCAICVRAKVIRPSVFRVEDCLANSMLCSKHPKSVSSPSQMVPDLLLEDLFVINEHSYTISNIIAEGGFGVVYKGLWKDQEIAIKELKKDETDVKNFKKEMRLTSKLNHPNLVKLLGVSLQPKLRMILEYCSGGDLLHKFHYTDPTLESDKVRLATTRAKVNAQRKKFFAEGISTLSIEDKKANIVKFQNMEKVLLKTEEDIVEKQNQLDFKHISWSLRLKVALDIAYGMRYLHTAFLEPVVHRDLRSPNVFIVSMDENSPINAKVADLGLSTTVNPQLSDMMLNWECMGPEIYSHYDEKLDVYSYGILLWEITTNLLRKPFDEYEKTGMKVTTIKQKIVLDNLRPTIPGNCPASLGQLIRDCWKGDPTERPSFNEICEYLEKVLHGLNNEDVVQIRNSRHGSVNRGSTSLWINPLTLAHEPPESTSERKSFLSVSTKRFKSFLETSLNTSSSSLNNESPQIPKRKE